MRWSSKIMMVVGLGCALFAWANQKGNAAFGLTGKCTGFGNCAEKVILPDSSECNCASNAIPTCLGDIGLCNWKAKSYLCPGTNSATGLPCNGVLLWGGCK